jgi:heat shock protein HslJ
MVFMHKYLWFGTMTIGLSIVLAACQQHATPVPPAAFDPANATYTFDGRPITLVNGRAFEAASGSEVAVTTTMFGQPVSGDLNGDGMNDAVVMLVRDTGGTGTFYYVAADINQAGLNQGTNAIVLGDRIAPQNVETSSGQVIANYADRNPGEPMTTPPSLGVSKYFTVTAGRLVPVQKLSSITNRAWKWVHTQMNSGVLVSPKKADAFTVTFHDDGSVTGTTDCNSFFGQATITNGNVSFGTFGATMMYCEGSQQDVFLQDLSNTQLYQMNPDGSMQLQLKMDSATMLFR